MNRLEKLQILQEINKRGMRSAGQREEDYCTCLAGRAARDSRFIAEGARVSRNRLPHMSADGALAEINTGSAIFKSFAEFFGLPFDTALKLCSMRSPKEKAAIIAEAIRRVKDERAATVARLVALTEPPAINAPPPEQTARERATMSRVVGHAGRAVKRALSRA